MTTTTTPATLWPSLAAVLATLWADNGAPVDLCGDDRHPGALGALRYLAQAPGHLWPLLSAAQAQALAHPWAGDCLAGAGPGDVHRAQGLCPDLAAVVLAGWAALDVGRLPAHRLVSALADAYRAGDVRAVARLSDAVLSGVTGGH